MIESTPTRAFHCRQRVPSRRAWRVTSCVKSNLCTEAYESSRTKRVFLSTSPPRPAPQAIESTCMRLSVSAPSGNVLV